MPNRKNDEKLGARRSSDGPPDRSGKEQKERLAPQMDCSACEAALADALDGRLDPATQKAFDEHIGICAGCGPIVADARRGLAWLEILKESRPEPPPTLLASILAQTSGPLAGDPPPHHLAAGSSMALPGAVFGVSLQTSARDFPLPQRPSGPAAGPAGILSGIPAAGTVVYGSDPRQPVSLWDSARWDGARWNNVNMAAIGQAARRTVLQPRLAMTAAMAFFSITLTMNLMGIHLADLRASDLKPSSIRRSFYEANARVVRNLDNLRVVYEVEASVRDLRRASEPDNSGPNVSGPDASGSAGSGNQTAQPSQTQPSQTQPSQTRPSQTRPNDSAAPQEKKHAAPGPNDGTSRREPEGNRTGSRILADFTGPHRQPAQQQSSPGVLALDPYATPAPRAENELVVCSAEPAAGSNGQNAAIKAGLRTSTSSEQLVSQGVVSKSGMPGRRMA